MEDLLSVALFIGWLCCLWGLCGLFINFWLRTFTRILNVTDSERKFIQSISYLKAIRKGLFVFIDYKKFIDNFLEKPTTNKRDSEGIEVDSVTVSGNGKGC
ncbi:hypothetical protein PVK63_14440 [Aliivibrio sp. S2TY2]|uniref:hypothetical protein n=1 Tax=unclassified Aliivibrio TaxID=2645654 RepID=UPI0023782B3D|nr:MULTISPECIES: hypothetical protein [unclassified Aliivibrio]MDD9175941.1 hypothetical protein [Aliivibrio sp. S3TY1]MDD9193144.1 hypothetical protein [Aliivibrio sp. S2TY2]